MTRNNTVLTVLAAVLVIALAWLFLISPQNEELAQIEAETEAELNQAQALRLQIEGLEQVRVNAPEIEATLAEIESVVPKDPALPSTLRQLQAAADDAGVTLRTLTPNRPVSAEIDTMPDLYSIGLSMTITGSYFQTVDFLRRLEDPSITARGLEVTATNMTRVDEVYPQLEVAIIASAYAVLDAPPEPIEEEAPVATAPATDETDTAAESGAEEDDA